MRWLLLSAALIVGLAFSQDPVPSSTKKAAPPKQQTENAQKPAADYQRGTEERPFVIQIIDGKKAEAKAAEHQKKSGDKPSFIWGMTAEEATAIFTFALVIVGAITAATLICQNLLMRQSVKAMRDEFHASHLPKLVVRRVVFVGGEPGTPTRISYVITNVGDAAGEIVDSSVSLDVAIASTPMPFQPPYQFPGNGMLNGTKIGIGETARFEITSPDLTEQRSVLERQTNLRIMLLGWILYKNPGGTRRYTAFARIYSATVSGFVKHKDPDYTPEYDRYEYNT